MTTLWLVLWWPRFNLDIRSMCQVPSSCMLILARIHDWTICAGQFAGPYHSEHHALLPQLHSTISQPRTPHLAAPATLGVWTCVRWLLELRGDAGWQSSRRVFPPAICQVAYGGWPWRLSSAHVFIVELLMNFDARIYDTHGVPQSVVFTIKYLEELVRVFGWHDIIYYLPNSKSRRFHGPPMAWHVVQVDGKWRVWTLNSC